MGSLIGRYACTATHAIAESQALDSVVCSRQHSARRQRLPQRLRAAVNLIGVERGGSSEPLRLLLVLLHHTPLLLLLLLLLAAASPPPAQEPTQPAQPEPRKAPGAPGRSAGVD